MRAEHKDFTVFDYDETVSKIDLSETHRLHLAPHEHDTRFVGVLDEIVVIGFLLVAISFPYKQIIYYYYPLFKR